MMSADDVDCDTTITNQVVATSSDAGSSDDQSSSSPAAVPVSEFAAISLVEEHEDNQSTPAAVPNLDKIAQLYQKYNVQCVELER